MRNWILILSLLMLAGCAGGGQPSAVADEAKGDAQAEEQVADAGDNSENEMVCTREKKVGSNMYQRVCKSRSQIEAEREASQGQLRRERSLQGAGSMQGGGG